MVSQTSSASHAYGRLRRRAEFVAAQKGFRTGTPAFGLQAMRRTGDAAADAPRFGLTITKRTAPRAVDRNRMRRRLREALRLGAALSGTSGHDYVIVGRTPLLAISFDELGRSLAAAIERVGRGRRGGMRLRDEATNP